MSSEQQNKPRGRPRASVQGTRVTTWIPNHEHQRLTAIASHTGLSVSKVVKRLIARDVRPDGK